MIQMNIEFRVFERDLEKVIRLMEKEDWFETYRDLGVGRPAIGFRKFIL